MTTTDEIKGLIASGKTVCNVGQWSKAAAAWIRKAHKRGELERVPSGYPDGRWAYRAA